MWLRSVFRRKVELFTQEQQRKWRRRWRRCWWTRSLLWNAFKLYANRNHLYSQFLRHDGLRARNLKLNFNSVQRAFVAMRTSHRWDLSINTSKHIRASNQRFGTLETIRFRWCNTASSHRRSFVVRNSACFGSYRPAAAAVVVIVAKLQTVLKTISCLLKYMRMRN